METESERNELPDPLALHLVIVLVGGEQGAGWDISSYPTPFLLYIPTQEPFRNAVEQRWVCERGHGKGLTISKMFRSGRGSSSVFFSGRVPCVCFIISAVGRHSARSINYASGAIRATRQFRNTLKRLDSRFAKPGN